MVTTIKKYCKTFNIEVNNEIFVLHMVQSITIKKYTAGISLSSLICLAGTIQSLAIALVVEHRPSGWAVGWNSRLFAPLYSVSTFSIKYIIMVNQSNYKYMLITTNSWF